jgi:hypothetical protein
LEKLVVAVEDGREFEIVREELEVVAKGLCLEVLPL